MASRIELLINVCKIKEVLITDGLHENHPLAVEVGNAVRKNAGNLKLFICDFRDQDSPVTSNMFILRRLVGLIGYKLPQIKQVRIDKQQVRIHGLAAPDFEKIEYTDKKGNIKRKLKLDDQGKAIPISDGREDVFRAWKEKELTEIESLKALTVEEIVNSESMVETSNDPLIPLIVDELQSVETIEQWDSINADITEAQMEAAWNTLTQDVRDKITGLFIENRHEAHT